MISLILFTYTLPSYTYIGSYFLMNCIDIWFKLAKLGMNSEVIQTTVTFLLFFFSPCIAYQCHLAYALSDVYLISS